MTYSEREARGIYSQRDEQGWIVRICEGLTPMPRFLDIGAWNPKVFSNTRALFELGWGGLCIEPSPGPVKELVKEYGDMDCRIEILAAAVGCEAGLAEIRVTDDAVSGNSGEQWQSNGGFYGWLTVPVITIPEILHRYGSFEMVSIDTEGTSVPLFLSLLQTQMRPACVVVEHDNHIVEIMQAAQEAGYTSRYISEENVVLEFTSREKA
jgi:FkbM family methyltransferase